MQIGKLKILLVPISLVFVGCAPSLIVQKSPINSLEQNRCFIFPSKKFLSKSPLYLQNLYQITKNSLDKHNIYVYYGRNKNCKNYLLTNFKVTTKKRMVTDKGVSYTSTYGNIYKTTGAYSPSSYTASSYTYNTGDTTYEKTDYYGHYSLEVGTIDGNDFIKVWVGDANGKVSGDNIEEAQKVGNDDQEYVSTQVEQMLKENLFIK